MVGTIMMLGYLGLGSNRGDRRAHLRAAVEGFQDASRIRVTAASPVYETEAHTRTTAEDQPPFLNAVMEVLTERSPEDLFRIAQTIESEEGRRRPSAEEWAPRRLDIDILAVGDLVRETEDLTVPHPRIAERRFVLQPWADLAPNFKVPPPFDASVQVLLEACSDRADVRETSDPLSVSLSAKSHGRNEEGDR